MIGQVYAYGRSLFGQGWKFGLVGVITFGLYFASFSLFYEVMELDYRIAVSIAYVITVTCHFLLNKAFTFEARHQRINHNLPRYLVMLVVNYLITVSVTWLVVSVIGASPYIGLVASTLTVALVSFFTMKYFVFSETIGM